MQSRCRWLPVLALLAAPASAISPDPYRLPVVVTQTNASLLVDLSTGQTLHERSSRTAMHPASLTKVMTALVVFDQIKAGILDESSLVEVRPNTAARWSGKGTTLSLRANEQVRLGDLILATTAASANDAAVVLAEASAGSVESFAALANQRASRLGMRNSRFRSANGMPDRGATITTAEDMAILARTLIEEHPVLYRRYFGQPGIAWRGTFLRNRDPLTGFVPGADGIKTGHTGEAGYNFLGSLERGGRRLVLVIGGAPSEAQRADAARALAEWGFAAWDSQPLAPAGMVVGEARVQDGNKRTVGLALPRTATFARPAGGNERPSARIVYAGPIKAPIRRGDQVARLEMRMKGLKTWSLPLVAAEDVPTAGPIDRIVNGLLGLVE